MAINVGPFSGDENSGAQVQSLLGLALGLTPLGFGIHAAINSVGPIPGTKGSLFKSGGSLRHLGEAVGEAAAAKRRKPNDKGLRVEKALKDALGDSAVMKKLIGTTDEQMALLHSFSVALDDPSFGMDATRLQSVKNQILTAMDNLSSGGTASDVIEDLVKTIVDTGNPESLGKLGGYMDEYKKIGKQIVPPKLAVPASGVSFNAVSPTTLSQKAYARAKDLEQKLGNDHQIKYGKYVEDGVEHEVAQVFDKTSGTWRANFPLVSGDRTYRAGQSLNTRYVAPAAVADASVIHPIWKSSTRSSFKSGGVAALRAAPGAIYDFEDRQIKGLDRFTGKDGRIQWQEYRAFQNDPAITMPRGVSMRDPKFGSFTNHVRSQILDKNNVIHIEGLTSLPNMDRMEMIAQLSASRGADAGTAKRGLKGSGADATGTVGLMDGSGFGQLQKVYGITRDELPVLAREAQVLGRTTQSVDPLRMVGAKGNVAIGGTGAASHLNAAWGDRVTGGYNIPIVHSFRPDDAIQQGFGGQGFAITGVKHQTLVTSDVSVLEAQAHGHGRSSLVQRAIDAGPGNVVHLTKSEIHSPDGIYIGEGSTGRKMYGRNPTAQEGVFGIDRISDDHGKKTIHAYRAVVEEKDTHKFFSLTNKGMVDRVAEAEIERAAGNEVMGALKSVGINPMEAVYAPSDHFSKGSVGFVHQIAQSTKLFSGIEETALSSLANDSSTEAMAKAMFGADAGKHAQFAIAAVTRMAAEGTSAKHIGMTLAGVYWGAEGKGKAGHGLDQGALETLVNNVVKGPGAVVAIDAMKLGRTIFVETMQEGEGTTTWGQGRGGLEPRSAKFMYDNFRTLGATEKEAARSVASIYENKAGFANHFALNDELLKMADSLTPTGRNVGYALSEGNIGRMSMAEYVDAKTTGNMSLLDMLKQDKYA